MRPKTKRKFKSTAKRFQQIDSFDSNAELLDVAATCHFLGGTKPINAATLYRGIAASRFPKPIRVGLGSSRWLRSELQAARERMIAARDAA